MAKKKKKFNVLSPDGITIHPTKTYSSKEAAREAFEKWRDGYKFQGYYSYRMERIPLKDLHEYCSLIEV